MAKVILTIPNADAKLTKLALDNTMRTLKDRGVSVKHYEIVDDLTKITKPTEYTISLSQATIKFVIAGKLTEEDFEFLKKWMSEHVMQDVKLSDKQTA